MGVNEWEGRLSTCHCSPLPTLPHHLPFHLAEGEARQVKQLEGFTLYNRVSQTCGYIHRVSWMYVGWEG